MKLSQYGYEFSPEMLAKYPADNRDESRLMVINRATGTIEHRIFKDIIEYFDEEVVNYKNPFLLSGMAEAVDVLRKAISENKCIIVETHHTQL